MFEDGRHVLELTLQQRLAPRQDFTFGLTVDDEEDGIMGTIVVPANAEDNINDGDLLCILLHRGNVEEESSATEKESGDKQQE
jgi:hypothetical protein